MEEIMIRRTAPCPAEYTLGVIGGRWKVSILWKLFQGEQRFSDLFRAMNGPTQKMLTQQLRELERDGLVHRQVYAQVPPKVEYSLTSLGMSLKPVVNAMCDWGKKHQEETRVLTELATEGAAPASSNGAKRVTIMRPLRRIAAR
jgi:DNA-binding HxlR family transcriptional regulator